MQAEWTYRSRRSDFTRTEPLELLWEVVGDPISDSYTPDEVSAHELFGIWFRKYGAENGGLLHIYWTVSPVMETAPLQVEPFGEPNFGTYWSEPVNTATGDPINWMTLPVVDKLWNAQRADKGGFIQEATGWKPSPLQPYVTAASLRAAAAAHPGE